MPAIAGRSQIKDAISSRISYGLRDFVDFEGVLTGVVQVIKNNVCGGHTVADITGHHCIDQRRHLTRFTGDAWRPHHHLSARCNLINHLQHIERISGQACTGIWAGVCTRIAGYFGIAKDNEVAAGLCGNRGGRFKL